MQELLTHLFKTFIGEQCALSKQIIHKSPLQLTNFKQILSLCVKDSHGQEVLQKFLTSDNFGKMQYWVAKGYMKFSPSNMQISLSHANILFYQRIFKLKQFVSKRFNKTFVELFGHFIQQELLPVQADSQTMRALLSKSESKSEIIAGEPVSKSKKKEGKKEGKKEVSALKQVDVGDQTGGMDYNYFVYEYSNEPHEKEGKFVVNIQELTNFLKYSLLEREIHNRKSKLIESMKKTLQLEVPLEAYQMYRIAKEDKQKSPVILDLISTIRYERIQCYLVRRLQKYDVPEVEDEEQKEDNKGDKLLSRDALLIFNLIRKYPFSSEKELLERSFLPQIQAHKCLNCLLKEGIISPYPQNTRCIVFKAVPDAALHEQYVAKVATSLRNVHVAMDCPTLKREDFIRLELMINELDDSLLLMGY